MHSTCLLLAGAGVLHVGIAREAANSTLHTDHATCSIKCGNVGTATVKQGEAAQHAPAAAIGTSLCRQAAVAVHQVVQLRRQVPRPPRQPHVLRASCALSVHDNSTGPLSTSDAPHRIHASMQIFISMT